MIRYSILILLVIIMVTGCIPLKTPPKGVDSPKDPLPTRPAEKPTEIKEPEEDPIVEMLKSMTLDEKLGQLLIVGIEGLEISENDIKNIRENKIGGLILFSRNIANKDQLLKLLNDLNEENRINKIPLFLSIDEEGGKVSRLSPIVNNLKDGGWLGEVDDINISYKYGQNLGLKLKSFGFNLNFAPVLDINSNPSNPVIGSRAYGRTAKSVADHGLAVMEGIRSQNIIPVAKHFPGHGDTSVDSHLDLPIVYKTINELKEMEIIPFQKAVDNGLDMIMVAHILFPEIDKNNPATLSPIIIDDILRRDMKFEGVIISDDMTMGAVLKNYSLEEASFSFLKAGGDIVLVSHGQENPQLVLDRIKKAIKDGQISIEEIDKKLYRILKLKDKFKIDPQIIEDTNIEKINRDTREINNLLK